MKAGVDIEDIFSLSFFQFSAKQNRRKKWKIEECSLDLFNIHPCVVSEILGFTEICATLIIFVCYCCNQPWFLIDCPKSV